MPPKKSQNRIRLNKNGGPPATGDNNPPAISLELTLDEAQFLFDNCNANIRLTLTALNSMNFSREGAEKAVAMVESFKALREKLIKQGIKET